MKKQERTGPGFQAIMMAAAYAEEGLAEMALATLREEARERAHLRRVARERPEPRERLTARGFDR